MKKTTDHCYTVSGIKRIALIAAAITGFFAIPSYSFAQQHIPWVAPKQAQGITNPLSGSQAALADGKTLYISNCAPCHGNKGRGDGPAAAALSPKPADHSSATVQGETDGSLFWKVAEGRTPMPSYKAIFSEKQRWELVNYIRTLAKSKAVK
jgi:mono/diheme cytochrome c family protein